MNGKINPISVPVVSVPFNVELEFMEVAIVGIKEVAIKTAMKIPIMIPMSPEIPFISINRLLVHPNI